MSRATPTRPQVAVIGAGLAGLYGALSAAAQGASVTLVTKGSLRASNSFMAQGGIAAAIGPGDSPDQHLADTLTAGRGLCNADAVGVLVTEGIERIGSLERLGVEFDRAADGTYEFGREGGHGRNRILHAGGSATGAAIAERLIACVRAEPRIRVLEHASALALISDGSACAGAWVLHRDELLDVRAPMTLLATGGAGALYARTTNPPGATGDGIAIARDAGAELADMEFVQFHPTALAIGERAFLISEAVRGEGAWLVDADGRRFMLDLHPDAELAPRDVVASALHARTQEGQTTNLALGHLDPARIRSHFPNLVEGCAAVGLDLTRDPIPVAPAAHYLMGGDRHRPRRSRDAARPVRRRRVRLHRRPRRQPPRVQLVARMLCVLTPRGHRRTRAAGAAGRRGTAPPAQPARAAGRAPAADVARRGTGAIGRGPRAAARLAAGPGAVQPGHGIR